MTLQSSQISQTKEENRVAFGLRLKGLERPVNKGSGFLLAGGYTTVIRCLDVVPLRLETV